MGKFQKGQSGNPSGRPRKNPELRAKIEAAAPDCVDFLVALAKGEGIHAGADISERRQAAKTILEWAVPKPAPEAPKGTGDRIAQFIADVAAVASARPKDDDDDD